MTQAEQFQAAMDELAAIASSDDVAAFLASQGITGVRRRQWCCPVANYVRKKCPAAKCVSAGLFWVWWNDGSNDPGRSGDAKTTESIQAFMARFDNGAFPGLEAPQA